MKKTFIIASLLASISGYSQVHMQFKNTTNKRLIIEVPLWDSYDTIAAKGVGEWKQVPGIHTNQYMRIIFAPNEFQEVNSNTAIADTAYTKGNFTYLISYDPAKKKYSAKLKTL